MRIEIKHTQEEIKKFKNKQKELARKIQITLAKFLDIIRADAADEMIPNITGTPNPYQAKRIQPSIAGRLTSRTGKWAELLRQRTDGTGYLGGRIFKKFTGGFASRVRDLKGKHINFTATITSDANMALLPGRTLSRGGKGRLMPKENKDTLDARGLHEEDRPIFKKAFNKHQGNIVSAIRKNIDLTYAEV